MTRRQLIALAAAAPLAGAGEAQFESFFLQILTGFLRNARRTSDSYAVCDLQGGTLLKNSLAKSGKTYDSVSRMLPAIAAWVASGRPREIQLDGDTVDLLEVLKLAFRNAFDPEHPDYWLPSPHDRTNQRQVEASMVAWSLWVVRDSLMPLLTSADRAHIQQWLASCTRWPVRRNNWAWFTAVVQAACLSLGRRWPEFSGDAKAMEDDLASLDALGDSQGWYTDSPTEPIYDYYNFWVFGSHFLYWDRMIGADFPKWRGRFGARLKPFLDSMPYVFASSGGHVLFGRSLIYRWAVLTPGIMAYAQGYWPHSPGLLRSLVTRNVDYHQKLGAFDAASGKLRETYTPQGTRGIREAYVDNGHPYWCMQAYALFLIPKTDPFWSARAEPLPVERGDFELALTGPGILLSGVKSAGSVQWLNARSIRSGREYRDKYTKFSYSSAFPFNIEEAVDQAAWDSNLVFYNPATGHYAVRSSIQTGEVSKRGITVEWRAVLDGIPFHVKSQIAISGGYQKRTHSIVRPAGSAPIQAIEGSYPLGLADEEKIERGKRSGWLWIRSRRSGALVAVDNVAAEVTEIQGTNVVHPRSAVLTTRVPVPAGKTVITSVYYAGPVAALVHPGMTLAPE